MMVGGPLVVVVALGVLIAIWVVVLLGSRFFGSQ